MQHLITLQQIRDNGIADSDWRKLLYSLGNPEDLNIQVSFGDIAKSIGAYDAVWRTRCIDDRRFILSMIMPSVKRASKRTSDQQVHDGIAVLERWLAGDNSVDLESTFEVVRSAAYRAMSIGYNYNYVSCGMAESIDVSAVRAIVHVTPASDAEAEAERQRQVEDIIAVSPLYALK